MQPEDLSLLVIFDAIMTEGSITKAAERLAITQPAVSNALARMRSRWNDELFVRDGKTMRPISFANNLALQGGEPLQRSNEAVSRETFDPATSRRSFRVCAIVDVAVDDAWCALSRIIENEAPGVNVHTFPYDADEIARVLSNGDVDLIVGYAPASDRLIRSERVFAPRYVTIMRKDHLLAQGDLTLERYARADHLSVSSMSCDTADMVDHALGQHGLRRRLAMTAHHFALAPRIVAQSGLIATVPSTSIEQALFGGEVVARPPPMAVFASPVACLWHKRQDNDPGLVWLRRRARGSVAARAAAHQAELVDHLRD